MFRNGDTLRKIKKIPVYLPLRFKIMGSFIATLFLFSIFIFTFYPLIERKHLNQDVRNKYLSRGTMLAFDLGEGKMMMDSNLIRRALKMTEQDSEFTYIAVKNTDGKLLYQYNPQKLNNLKLFSSKQGFFQYQGNHYYSETFPVIIGHSDYGTLQIAGSLEHHYLLIHKSILISLFVSLFILFVGFFISYFFSKRVTTPLSQLQKATEKIKQGNFDEIVPSDSTDEIGALGQSFNEMEATVRRLINDLNKEILVRKESEKALRDSETQLTTLIETIPELIWVKDPERKYVWYNNKFEQFFEIPTKSWIGKTDTEINFSKNADFYEEKDHEVISQRKTVHFEEKISLGNKRKSVFLKVIKTPLYNSNGDLTGLLGIGQDITSGKQTEEALSNSEAQMKAFIQTVPDPVWLKDRNGCFIWCNTAFEKMNNLTEKDIKGKTNYELGTPETAVFYAQGDQQVMKTKKLLRYEGKTFSQQEGKEVTMETIKAPMLDSKGEVIGVLSIARDITKLKQVEDELAGERTLLRTIIDILPESIYAKDKEGRKILANPEEVKFSGKQSEEEVLGKTDFELYPKEEAMIFLEEDSAVLESGKLIRDLESSFADGKGHKHWFLGIKVPLFNAKREIVGLVGMNHDITERKLAEAKIRERNEELTKINAEKDKFFSIIAHDLRGPFSNFIKLTEMMAEEIQDMSQEQLQKMATAMNTSASKLYGLLENLLQWSRSQRNTITFEPKLLKLSNLVDRSIKPLIDSATKKELIFEKSIPENIQIFADSNMMETVIRNLFSNALKFTPRKGKVSIVASSKNTKWTDVAIQDTGIGMNKDLLADLFTLSSHIGRKGTEGEPSSGLGLILCKEFAEKNGGSIRVESKENVGTTFYLTVPAGQTKTDKE